MSAYIKWSINCFGQEIQLHLILKWKFNRYNPTATYPHWSPALIQNRDGCLLCLMPCLLACLPACLPASCARCLNLLCFSLHVLNAFDHPFLLPCTSCGDLVLSCWFPPACHLSLSPFPSLRPVHLTRPLHPFSSVSTSLTLLLCLFPFSPQLSPTLPPSPAVSLSLSLSPSLFVSLLSFFAWYVIILFQGPRAEGAARQERKKKRIPGEDVATTSKCK